MEDGWKDDADKLKQAAAVKAQDEAQHEAQNEATNQVPIEAPEADLRSAQFSQFAARLYQARPAVEQYVRSASGAPLGAEGRDDLVARFDVHYQAALGASAGSSHQAPGGDSDARYRALCAALRYLRDDVFCQLMERDLNGQATLDEVTHTMSALAEFAVGRALRTIEADMTVLFGAPLAESSQAPLTLGVIGMGKLGGRELNVSSDIDLIFVYEEDGQTAGGQRAAIDNHDFFTRVGRKLIAALTERTAEGYVFRVDMRLRPNGDSGPLVCSLAMLEEYFYVQGREWERYAWIKSRLLPNQNPAHRRLSAHLGRLVRPFVFRRYLDFGVIDAIRSLHEQIAQEARRRALLRPELSDDVKLGRGGIREIEFGAQVFQLVRGGQDAGLRIRPTLGVLAHAAKRGLIGEENVAALTHAYTFLRQLEHRLQYADDAQTHAMPIDADARQRLAASLNFTDYATLHRELERHRSIVEREFNQIFVQSGRVGEGAAGGAGAAGVAATAPPVQHVEITSLWSEALFDTRVKGELSEADHAAAALGYAPDIVGRLRATRMSLRYLQLPAQSKTRFDALVLRAIDAARQPCIDGTVHRNGGGDAAGRTGAAASAAIAGAEGAGAGRPTALDASAASAALSRLLDFLERIGGRSAYLALLTEYPAALQRVLSVLGNSQWAARYLISHPQLLDELLDGDAIDAPFDWQKFGEELRATLRASDGPEQQMDQLRHAQHAEVFRILLRELAGRIDVETVGDRLSELADAVLSVTLEAVWRSIKDRPMLDGDLPAFAIVAYGKLGGKELGYVSDLDLIFLFDVTADPARDPASATSDDLAEVYTRLARRLVTWMTTATGAGQLYDIDLRLRPNGSSGLMVTPLDGFRRYQTRPAGEANTAWVWEHQAITRARFCAGDARIGAAFEAIRATVVTAERQAAPLAGEIVAMRERAREGHAHRTGLFDLKHDRGGMVDIEFIVQYLVLLHAAHHPTLIDNLGNIALLKICATLNILTLQEADTVGAAYRRYRALQHRLRLDGISDARVPAEAVAAETGAVRALWERIFSPFGPFHALDFGAGGAKSPPER